MYRRSYYRGRGSKYSNETICVNAQVTASTDAGDPLSTHPIIVVPPTDVLGNRKVKNFTLKFNSYLCDNPVIGVLAYVPEGTEMNKPLVTGPVQSLYEPNQNVIATFVIPPSCTRTNDGDVHQALASTTIVVSNKLARNLNTGDSIKLALVSPDGITAGDGQGDNPPPAQICGTINFSIKY